MQNLRGRMLFVPWEAQIVIPPKGEVEEFRVLPSTEDMVQRMRVLCGDPTLTPFYESFATYLGAGNSYKPSDLAEKLLRHIFGFSSSDPKVLLGKVDAILSAFFSGKQLAFTRERVKSLSESN